MAKSADAGWSRLIWSTLFSQVFQSQFLSHYIYYIFLLLLRECEFVLSGSSRDE